MISKRVLFDSSGLFALLDTTEAGHSAAKEWMEGAHAGNVGLVATDYILDETTTLLMARRLGHLARRMFDMVDLSDATEVVHIDAERFTRARHFFLKHLDQGYSFTDCTSFVVMKELKLKEALTTDAHFRTAGFVPLLA